LLRAQAAIGSFQEKPAVPPRTVDDWISERPGSDIGPYKILEQIGEGGFGVVFLAEQQQPIRRQVAMKILKPGMGTRQVVARFESERQALALMDHPNIARVHDAGTTELGRPYFVMELVRGLAITEFCDQYQLPPEDRLKLFIDVCHAIQHAHQKGVIHRDIKHPLGLVFFRRLGNIAQIWHRFGIGEFLLQTDPVCGDWIHFF